MYLKAPPDIGTVTEFALADDPHLLKPGAVVVTICVPKLIMPMHDSTRVVRFT
jgi:hypothetical protein